VLLFFLILVTNYQVTIDMRYIGGEQNWATPPMEGHLAQGLSELTGEDNYPERELSRQML
jgi:hypothetical protein